ncbi:ATP-binding protein [Evansella tamaricis]|nr:ATP-binding protein [Evansella tamaricis]
MIILIIALLVFSNSLLFYFFREKRNLVNELNRTIMMKKQYQSFIKDIPIAIIFLIKGKIKDINESGLVMLGATLKDDVEGKSIFHYIPREYWEPSTKEESLFKSTANGHNMMVLQREDGSKVDISMTYQQVYFQDSWGYGLVIKDITDLKDSEKRLRHSEQLSVIGELAAGIAHEIRNPLTSLKGFLQLISHESSGSKYEDIMSSELERINLIVNELLLLAKPKEMEFEPTRILSLLKTVVTIANTQAILHNIQIKLVYNEELEKIMIYCEENKLKQVFLNLLKNAIEAMNEEGNIYIKFKKLGDKLHLFFIDEGPGISKEIIGNLGKRFYTTKPDGTGLGLMISMNIIREHQGELFITSEEGIGTKVEVVLPIKESPTLKESITSAQV